MRALPPTPNLAGFWEQLDADPGRAARVLHASQQLDNPDLQPYLHWEELRHRDPPEGLTSQEWWYAVKLARTSARREIAALTDNSSTAFSFVLTDDLLRRLDEVSRRASGQILASEPVTDADTRDRYIVSSLIEEAVTSSQMEGAATTRQVARDMLRSGRQPRDRSERMIANNYRAMQRIRELKDEPLTPALVREVHRIVTEGTLDDPSGAGRIQQIDEARVHVGTLDGEVLHQPPPAEQLGERLERLCAFANGESPIFVPPVLRALTLHFMIGYDHYFADGNGRTARTLFYWALLHEGYWLAEFLTISPILKNAPAKYQRSFQFVECDDGDLTYFFDYHVGVLLRAIDDLYEHLSRKSAQLRETRAHLGQLSDRLNHRQLALLSHALRHVGFVYTATSHATSHRVTVTTALTDLDTLARLGLLHSFKQGRRKAYRAPQDLDTRISDLTAS